MTTDPRLFDVDEPWTYDAKSIIEQAVEVHQPSRVFVLFSGGNDSLVLLHSVLALGYHICGAIHVNTLTGVCEDGVYLTSDFARRVCDEWDVPFHELFPPKTFEQIFLDRPIIDGLPGPGMHHIAYNRLKERALRIFTQEQKSSWRDRIMFLTGIRADESSIRMGYQDTIIDRVGAQVWVNPIYRLTNEEMHAYRQTHNLPKNPVSEHLHVSGECLCGTYSRPGELDEIRFFYPQTAARIDAWMETARANGLTFCTWGNSRRDEDSGKNLRLCQNCPGQLELL